MKLPLHQSVMAVAVGFVAFTALYAACTTITVPAVDASAPDACIPPDGARCVEWKDQ